MRDAPRSIQPRLAGLKHLNRLEQVLARAEWYDPCIDEGIMRALDGRVIECVGSQPVSRSARAAGHARAR
ncbi:MAG: hypothetical protein U5K43_15615 [Halofilum sp. (in: g-proteobacteria)]|nr:hypothetical protein [Halofilum sp. (in: g-proteobacteria)]